MRGNPPTQLKLLWKITGKYWESSWEWGIIKIWKISEITIGMYTRRRSYHEKQSETGRAESEVNIEGCRIINMDRLQEYTDNLTEHSRTCTRLSSRMFLDGAMPSRSSSVPIMHASATEVHSSTSSRTTPPIRVVAVSQQRWGSGWYHQLGAPSRCRARSLITKKLWSSWRKIFWMVLGIASVFISSAVWIFAPN